MGEKESEAWESVERGVASPPGADILLPSIQEQRTPTSYGSFSREFYLDTGTLNNLLSILDVKKADPSFGSALNSAENGNFVSGAHAHTSTCPDDLHPVTDDEGDQEILHRQKLGHRQKDSGIESPCHLGFLNPTDWSLLYLKECNKQFESLWSFTRAHLDQIADGYKGCQPTHRTTGAGYFGFQKILSPKWSLQADVNEKKSLLESEDVDSVSSDGDSGIGEDRWAAVRGCLQQLRNMVTSVKNKMEASVQQLTEFVVLHDRAVHSDEGERLLLKHRVQHADLLNRLADFVTVIDADLVIAKGYEDKRTHKKELEHMQAFYQAIKYRPGLVPYLCLLLLLATCVAVCVPCYKQVNQQVIFMRLVRSPLFIALYFFMYGANLMCWAKHGINYVTIFKYPAYGIPTPKLAFQIGSILSVCFSLLVTVYFLLDGNYLYIADKIVAALQWLLLLGFLINPVKMFIRRGRFAFILVWFRILFSPIPMVRFGDFWFADQLNSMVALFVDVQYFVCFSVGTSWFGETARLNQCTTNQFYIRPIISCIPSLWRFNQCLRCFYDTRQIKHLINAGKYFTTFPVVVFAVIFSKNVKDSFNLSNLNWDKTGWIIICWFIASLVHALYCFIWDITQDWGLFCFHKRTILRPTLFYNSKLFYLVAIVFDFIVRFLCALKLTLIIVYNLDSDLLYTGLVIAEIFRRFVWNFFRVEYEQVMINHKLEFS